MCLQCITVCLSTTQCVEGVVVYCSVTVQTDLIAMTVALINVRALVELGGDALVVLEYRASRS